MTKSENDPISSTSEAKKETGFKAKDLVCPACGKSEFRIVHNGRIHKACDCTAVDDLRPSHLGQISATSDGCRWMVIGNQRFGANELIVDPIQYQKPHANYFRECYAAGQERIELVKRNVKSIYAAHKPKDQFNFKMGWDQRQKGPLKGQPCWIVGSGPSLKENAHLLADVPGMVIALNSSIRLLPRYDWWMFCDYSWDVTRWFGNTLPRKPDMGAMVGTYANDSLLNYDWGRLCVYNTNNVGDAGTTTGLCREKFNNHDEFVIGHEVMYSAIHFAYLLGAGSIILVGADHCYSKEYHAGLNDQVYNPQWELQEMDRNGIVVNTTVELIRTALYLETAGIFFMAAGIPIIDCSRVSLIRQNVIPMSVEHVKEVYKRGKQFSSVGYIQTTETSNTYSYDYGVCDKNAVFVSQRIPMEELVKPGGTFGPMQVGKADVEGLYLEAENRAKKEEANDGKESIGGLQGLQQDGQTVEQNT